MPHIYPPEQTKTTSSSPLPSTSRSCTCGPTGLLWFPVVWLTRRPRSPCTERSLQRRSQPTARWWPTTPPRASSCGTPAQSIRESSTARLWPEAPHRSPPSTNCSMWRVGMKQSQHKCSISNHLSVKHNHSAHHPIDSQWHCERRFQSHKSRAGYSASSAFRKRFSKAFSLLRAELGLCGRLPAEMETQLWTDEVEIVCGIKLPWHVWVAHGEK